MTLVAWVTVAIFVGVYVLVATERVHRVAAALGGSALVLGFGIVGSEEAFYSPETGIDWDVIFLLLGMMLVVGVIRRTGVFEYLAIRSAKAARGRPYGVLVLLVLVTAGASALLDNVTTVLLVAPVTLLVCDRLGLQPIPFLLAEALASNIGGASTLVGDPPNIIIASRADLSFADFLVHMLPIVVVVLAAFLVLARFLFRRALVGDPARASALMALDEREAITDRTLAGAQHGGARRDPRSASCSSGRRGWRRLSSRSSAPACCCCCRRCAPATSSRTWSGRRCSSSSGSSSWWAPWWRSAPSMPWRSG